MPIRIYPACRHCRGPIHQPEPMGKWIHTESGDEWCPLSFGLSTAAPIIRVTRRGEDS